MLCYLVRRLIQAYLGDALRSGDADRLRRHCERCSSCAAAMRQAEKAARLVAALPRRSLTGEETDILLARVRARGQERLGERLLGTPAPATLFHKSLATRAAERWDALKHDAAVAGFRVLSRPAALPAYAALPIAAILLVVLHQGAPTPRVVLEVGTEQRSPAVRNAPPPPGLAGAPPPGHVGPLPGISMSGEPIGKDVAAGRRPTPAAPVTPPAPAGAARARSTAKAAPEPGAAGATRGVPAAVGALPPAAKPSLPGAAGGRPVALRAAKGQPIQDGVNGQPAATVGGAFVHEPIRGPRPRAAAARPPEASKAATDLLSLRKQTPAVAPSAPAAREVPSIPQTIAAPVTMAPPGGPAERGIPAAVERGPSAAADAREVALALPAPPAPREVPAGGAAAPTAMGLPSGPGGGGAGGPAAVAGGMGMPGAPGPATGGRSEPARSVMGAAVAERRGQQDSTRAAGQQARNADAQRKGKSDPRESDDLIRLLGGRSKEAAPAARELGRRKEARAVEALGRALRTHADADVREAAADALAAIGSREALAILRAAAASDGPAKAAAKQALKEK